MLRILDDFQGRGYAQFLIKRMCQKFVNEFDLDPITFVVENNIPSHSLFKKMGFIKTGNTYWIKC